MQLVGNIQSADSTLECNLRETFKTFKTRLSSSECKSRNEYGKIVVYGSGEQVSTTTFNGPWIEVSPSKFPSESFSSVAVESIKINLLVNCIALQVLPPPNNDLLLSATQWTGSSFHIIPFKTTHKHVPVQIASNLLPHWCLHSIAVPLLPTTQKLHSYGSISAVLLARFFSAETFVGTMLLFLRLQQLQLPLLGGAKLRTHHGHSHPLFSSRMGPFTRAQRYLSILNWAMDGCDIFYKYKYSQQTHDAILCITAQGIVWSDAYVIDTQGRLKLR